MALGLHRDLTHRLVELVAELLPQFFVVNNSFLDFDSFPDLSSLDAALPARSTQRQALVSYIGEWPVRSFLVSILSEALRLREFVSEDNRTQLTALPEFADPQARATAIVESFESLPFAYEVLVQIRHPVDELLRLGLRDGHLSLTPTFELLETSAEGGHYAHHITNDLEFFSGPKPNGVYGGSLYALSRVEGFIPRSGSSATLDNASEQLRSFLGLCIAQRLVKRGVRTTFGGPHRHYQVIFERNGQVPAPLHSAHEFTLESSEGIASLAIDKIFVDLPIERRTPAVARDLGRMGETLRMAVHDDRIARAAQWLFDSNSGSNPILEFVQATISLEILLGDKTESGLIGLGALIGNRCAFLVGKSATQRSEILADFKRIYDTRSRIVHRGHNRLSVTDEQDLWKLRWLCGRVIQEEMRLLSADLGKPAT